MTETDLLKSLANNALERLERNKTWNKTETKTSNLVSRPQPCETKKWGILGANLSTLSSLSEEYEERLAIAEYDGHQTHMQAQRVAYLDAFIAVLHRLRLVLGLNPRISSRDLEPPCA